MAPTPAQRTRDHVDDARGYARRVEALGHQHARHASLRGRLEHHCSTGWGGAVQGVCVRVRGRGMHGLGARSG